MDVDLDVGGVHELHGEALSETSDEESFDGEDGGDFVGQEGSLRLASGVHAQVCLQTHFSFCPTSSWILALAPLLFAKRLFLTQTQAFFSDFFSHFAI